MSELLLHYDAWLQPGGPSALIIKEFLEPAAGKGAVVFPPTFAPPEDEKDKTSQYVIDGDNENNSCLIDTIGSQANRLEPVFKNPPFNTLVPQVTIKIGERPVSIFDAGHRAGDAVVRSTSLAPALRKAFTAYDTGNAEPMAKLAPTSLVFGAWDSRDTGIKIPRLLESSVRATNVARLRRGAQYFSTLEPEEVTSLLEKDTSDAAQRKSLSGEGFLDSPAGINHGGVLVKGDIVRTTILNLTALRSIGAATPEATLAIRRYILGLALVAAAASDDLFLRQGCLLVQAENQPPEAKLVHRNGTRAELPLDFTKLAAFAAAAALAFGVGESQIVDFNVAAAKALLDKRAEAKPKKAK